MGFESLRLGYFQAHLVRLATPPSERTLGIFRGNHAMKYKHAESLADVVNGEFNVYRIRTEIAEKGLRVEGGHGLDTLSRQTSVTCWEKLDDELIYCAKALGRDVIVLDQIRTVIRTCKETLFAEIFPGRIHVPKTLIYAKDDGHADDIVRIVREVFGGSNDFCQKVTHRAGTARIVTNEVGTDGKEIEKITYRSTGLKPEDLLSSFRNDDNPRIAVTVKMIAPNTEIKPLEVIMYMRRVMSRNFIEQVKSRGVRGINTNDFKDEAPPARIKNHFVIVDDCEIASPQPDDCQCPLCRHQTNHPDQRYHRELRAFLATLNPEQRRLFAAVESNHLGRGGVGRVAEITGICQPTIARGRHQLAAILPGRPSQRDKKPSPGRPPTEERYPAIKDALEEMISGEVAGSPEGESRWVRSSTRKLTERLNEKGISVSYHTVWAILKRMGFSMKTHVRNRRGAHPNPAQRDEQFQYIASRRMEFLQAGLPVVSVDTKQKELIGNFRKRGRAWCREAPEVNEQDFASLAECLAVPYGIYDLKQNTGYVVVSLSHNTPEFAVSSICKWWQEEGRSTYPGASEILIFADGGGGNGSRSRAWKWNLKEMLCNPFGLTVTVCHYPPGCSKWNPVEHRLFSEISKNWEGIPLRSLRIRLGYIRGTTTTTGLRVKASLDEGIYRKGQKVTRQDLDDLKIRYHSVCSDWNYTINPSQ